MSFCVDTAEVDQKGLLLEDTFTSKLLPTKIFAERQTSTTTRDIKVTKEPAFETAGSRKLSLCKDQHKEPLPMVLSPVPIIRSSNKAMSHGHLNQRCDIGSRKNVLRMHVTTGIRGSNSDSRDDAVCPGAPRFYTRTLNMALNNQIADSIHVPPMPKKLDVSGALEIIESIKALAANSELSHSYQHV
jgi:hypothetical protein